MSQSRRKSRAVLIVVGLVVLLPLLILTQPRARAALRLASGFQPLEQNPKVFYEPGAEAHAKLIAEALPEAIRRVEDFHALPFTSEFRVYVCTSHESFTRSIGHPVDSPVRGIAFPWDIWVSPKAFSFYGRDTHRQTLAHELSHLHLSQHLGYFWRTKNIPAWFSEGLADWVADTGHERLSREEAREGLRDGRHLVPDASGRLAFPKGPADYGLTWPMFHMQSRMFVEYLVGRDEASFRRFLVSVLDGARFDATFEEHFGDSLGRVWQDFLDSLGRPSENADGARRDPGL